MMMCKFIFYIFLSICTIQAAPRKAKPTRTKATPLLTVTERSKILEEAQSFLKKPVYDLKDITLFTYKDEIIPPEDKPTEVLKTEPTINHNLLILQSVGKSIKPKGKLETNGQFVLCTQGSRILKAGDVLYAKYEGNTYSIILKTITKNQFTLQMDKQELTLPY